LGALDPFSEATIDRSRLPPHHPVPAAELDPAADQGCRREGDGRADQKRLRELDKGKRGTKDERAEEREAATEEAEKIYRS
jgi:hypothetical protein